MQAPAAVLVVRIPPTLTVTRTQTLWPGREIFGGEPGLSEPSGINGLWVAGPLSADTTIRVGGIVGTVINLLPLRVLPGGTIVDWNRLAWGALAVLALFVLLEVMIFPAHHPAHSSKTPLATTVALFAVFAAFSLLFRQYFSIRNRKKTEEPESLGVSVEAEAVSEIEQSEK